MTKVSTKCNDKLGGHIQSDSGCWLLLQVTKEAENKQKNYQMFIFLNGTVCVS